MRASRFPLGLVVGLALASAPALAPALAQEKSIVVASTTSKSTRPRVPTQAVPRSMRSRSSAPTPVSVASDPCVE